MLGNREQVSRLGYDQHMDLELKLARAALLPVPQASAGGTWWLQTSMCQHMPHYMKHTDSKFLPQCCIPGKKAASLMILKWAVIRTWKTELGKTTVRNGNMLSHFPHKPDVKGVMSKFRLCHIDLDCKNPEGSSKYPSKDIKPIIPEAIVQGDALLPGVCRTLSSGWGWRVFCASQSVAQANLRHDTDWSKACSLYKIFVTKVLPAKSIS